jgi:hypothetical protein
VSKKVNKSVLIRKALKKGWDRKKIVETYKVSPQLVYIVARNEGLLKKKKKTSKITKAALLTKQELDALTKPIKADLVNNPPHYTDGGVDTLSYIEAKDLNYRLGNVVKYVSRAGKKLDSDPLQDLMKARFYLQREIDIRREA